MFSFNIMKRYAVLRTDSSNDFNYYISPDISVNVCWLAIPPHMCAHVEHFRRDTLNSTTKNSEHTES